MNKRKLNAVMQLHGESQQNLADYLQMSLSRLNAKINEYRGRSFGKMKLQRFRSTMICQRKRLMKYFLLR